MCLQAYLMANKQGSHHCGHFLMRAYNNRHHIDVVSIEGVGNVVATRLVIKETFIPNALSPYFELLFFLVY